MSNYQEIGNVANLLGIPAHRVRYYETRLGLQVKKSVSGRRRYTESNVRRLQRFVELIESGFSIDAAAAWVKAHPHRTEYETYVIGWAKGRFA